MFHTQGLTILNKAGIVSYWGKPGK